VLGVETILSKNDTLKVAANQQKILRYWTKYAKFMRIISGWPAFSLGCRKIPWDDGPQFGTVL